MKKRLSVLLSVLLVFSFVLAGCGKKDSASTGLENTTWTLTAAKEEESGLEFTGDQLATLGLTDFSFEFKEDSKVTVSAAGQTGDGTYSVDGSEVTLESDGEKLALTLDGDKMEMKQDTLTMTFEKQ